VFADVKNTDQLAREEVFGPVLAVIPYDGDGRGGRHRQDTNYAWPSVWTADEARGIELARRVAHRHHRRQLLPASIEARRSAASKTAASAANTGPEGLDNYSNTSR